MADVIADMQQMDARPKVQPHEGCDDQAQIDSRQAMLKMMSSSMFAIVESEVGRLWQANSLGQSSVMQGLLPVEPPQEFWVAHYYEVVATIVAKIPSGVSASSSSPRNTSAGSAPESCDIVIAGAAQGGSTLLVCVAITIIHQL